MSDGTEKDKHTMHFNLLRVAEKTGRKKVDPGGVTEALL